MQGGQGIIGLYKFAAQVKSEVDVGHCQPFVASIRNRGPKDLTIAGVVDGVLLHYSSKYLYRSFG